MNPLPMLKRCIVTTGLLISMLPLTIDAQHMNAPEQIEAMIESIIENLEEESDAALIIEDLSAWAENPLNINNATANELSRLHMLDDIQIEKLLEHLKTYGPAYSIYELNGIDGFNPPLLKKMEPFVQFEIPEAEPRQLRGAFVNGRHELLLRSQATLQVPNGFQQREDGSTPFEGDRCRYNVRYRFTTKEQVSIGFTAEKDPGEALFYGSNRAGFDFYSGHIRMKISPLIEQVTLGDFVVQEGQGLVLWQGFSTGKSISVLNIYKTNQGIRPYTSTDENQFLRGFATTLRKGDLRINLFSSQKRRDANREASDSLNAHFTSLQTSGYHRTSSEIDDKRSVKDFNAGTVITQSFHHLKLGMSLLYREFSIPFIPNDQLYNRFRFRGTNNLVAGADYLFNKGKYRLFGEGAVSKSGGKALLQGATAHLHDQIQCSALFRHYEKDYQALWASAFSEGSSPANESGLYLGTRILPVQKITISAYSDLYRFEWIQFNTAAPAMGYDFLVQADFRISEKVQFHIRTKSERKEQKVKSPQRYQNAFQKTRKNRVHLQYDPAKTINLRTRLEHVASKSETSETGWMIYQDLLLHPQKIPATLAARIAWFHTDGYNSRIYAYENDLLYTYSMPASFGKGFRAYLNLKYKISKNWEVWFKLSDTWQQGVETIGSGYLEILGNQKTDVKFQIRLKI